MNEMNDKAAGPTASASPATIKKRHGFLNRNAIKYIIAALMLIDHIAEVFGTRLSPATYGIMRLFGRLVAPVLAFFIAEGFAHTRDVKKYRRRIGILALISWPACLYLFMGVRELCDTPFKIIAQSVVTAFYFAVVALCVWHSERLGKTKKIVIVVLLCLASFLTDMPVAGVLAPLFHNIFKDDRKKRYIALCLTYSIVVITFFTQGWYSIGILLVPPFLIFCYNGEGGRKTSFNKWFFYVFFPVHMVILGFIRWNLL